MTTNDATVHINVPCYNVDDPESCLIGALAYLLNHTYSPYCANGGVTAEQKARITAHLAARFALRVTP